MITSENLKKANEGLPTVDVKGKDYVMVVQRVNAFRDICPNGTIDTNVVDLSDNYCVIQAKIYDENDHLLASGTAQEKEGSTFINKTSFIENCETSAVGRALGMLGIGAEKNMASAEEVTTAILNQEDEDPQIRARKQLRICCDEHQMKLQDAWGRFGLEKGSPTSMFYSAIASILEECGE